MEGSINLKKINEEYEIACITSNLEHWNISSYTSKNRTEIFSKSVWLFQESSTH